MKTFLEFLEGAESPYGEGTDVLQSASNLLANCYADPFGYLGDLSKLANFASQQGDQKTIKVMRDLNDLALAFLNDVSNNHLSYRPGQHGKAVPDMSPAYNERYQWFMKQARRVLDELRK